MATPTNNLSQNEVHQSENLKEVPSETANENVPFDFSDEEVKFHFSWQTCTLDPFLVQVSFLSSFYFFIQI